MDRKGILSFLLITFTLTYVIEGGLLLSGFQFSALPPAYGTVVVACAMWIPAIATLITAKYVTREGLSIASIRIGSLRPYLVSALIVPVAFAIIYAISWGLGLVQPDWDLIEFRSMIASVAGSEIPPIASPGLALVGVFIGSTLAAPFFNSLFGFGEELGWRGYLLPKLMPLGKFRAYVILGVIWSLWHMPLIAIGFTYPSHPFLGLLAFTGMTTAFGIYLNEMTLRYRSSPLAGWIHGVFNSQKLGLWPLLFPNADPLVGGYSGIIGITAWLLLGLGQVWFGSRGDLGAGK
jgi:membrane protease YdiL (CAAX protease family)